MKLIKLFFLFQKIEVSDKHPSRLVTIFRNKIRGRIDTLQVSDDEKCILKKKLEGSFEV